LDGHRLMGFRIADTFTDSLGKLTGEEQRLVKTTAFDLQMNLASLGMSFHKLDQAWDARFGLVRVDLGRFVSRSTEWRSSTPTPAKSAPTCTKALPAGSSTPTTTKRASPYFLGANDPYKALKTTLKAEINEDAWATLNSDTSRPFEKPESGRIAVKVINHLGDEVMKVFRV